MYEQRIFRGRGTKFVSLPFIPLVPHISGHLEQGWANRADQKICTTLRRLKIGCWARGKCWKKGDHDENEWHEPELFPESTNFS
jgi:hypothetical protein